MPREFEAYCLGRHRQKILSRAPEQKLESDYSIVRKLRRQLMLQEIENERLRRNSQMCERIASLSAGV